MGVYVQGDRDCGVAQVAADGLYIIPGADGGDGVSMPLEYNNDKTGNPHGIRVLRV